MPLGADLNATENVDGATALMAASQNGHTKVVKALIAAGADLNAKNNDGNSALTVALKNGHTMVMEFLKRAGAR